MTEIWVNGCILRPHAQRGNGAGRMSYHIQPKKELRGSVKFPSIRVLERLALIYLECELTPETQIAPSHWYSFTINAGISRERKAAFLAAVMTHSTPINS